MLPHDIKPELQQAVRKLRLTPMLMTLPERLRQFRQKPMPPEDFLQILFSDEVQRRGQEASRKRASAAGLDPAMVLDIWDQTAKVTYDRDLVDKLATLKFVDAHYHVLCMGPVGVGKTFMAHALGSIACRRGLTVICESADKLFKRLKSARLDQSHVAELRRLFAVDLLIIDDFGLRPLDSMETSDFYDIIDERHRKGSMIVTSNREPAEWLPLLADPLHAQAAVDRFKNNAHDLVMEGESYRARQKPRP
jgi:DNA replication protein DnaC